MNRNELKKLISGTIVTLPTPMDRDFRVDMGRMAEMTRWWIAQGCGSGSAPLKVAAAMGEGPDLSDDEWPHLLRTVVNAAGPKYGIICAIKPKDTTKTIEDAKKAAARLKQREGSCCPGPKRLASRRHSRKHASISH